MSEVDEAAIAATQETCQSHSCISWVRALGYEPDGWVGRYRDYVRH